MQARSLLITGASSGIGLAAAMTLKARGWRVWATARTDTDLQRLASLGLEPVHLDLRDPASIAKAAALVLAATGGRLDALFNNAASGQAGAVEDLPTDALRDQFEVNLFGWHDLTRRLLPAMRARGSGRIVNCSSVLGIVALKYRGAYIASKFALEGLTDALRLELRGSGIDVVTIRPGPIATHFVETSLALLETDIDVQHSPHAAAYDRRIARGRRGGTGRMKSGPDAVVKKLIHALESPRPRPYYSVTVLTVLMDWARRLLTGRALVRALAAISDREA